MGPEGFQLKTQRCEQETEDVRTKRCQKECATVAMVSSFTALGKVKKLKQDSHSF